MFDKKLTALYSGVQASFWMGYATVMGFTSLYLLDRGFTNAQVGTVIATASLLAALAQPVTAAIADNPNGASPRQLILGLMGCGLCVSIALLTGVTTGISTALVYALGILMVQTGNGLMNSLGILGEKKPNFGLSRGIGSIAYAAIAYGLGDLADRFGSKVVPGSMLAAFCAIVILCLVYPDAKSTATKKKSSGNPIVFLKAYPKYALVLVGCTFIFISHTLLNSFTYQIAVSKGGGSSEMGTSMALSAMIEIPAMIFFNRMRKLRPSHFWFRICGIFFVFKNLFTLLCTTIPGFYAVQLFQLMGWGVIAVSSVYYINSIMQPEDAVKGQAYYIVTLTLGNVIGSAVGGWLMDVRGVNFMLSVGTVSAVIGAVFLFCFTQKGTEA